MKDPAKPTRVLAWEKVHERLARALAGTEAALQVSPERTRAVLEERARALARVPPAAPTAAEVLDVVTFDLGDERYAVETRHVREVVRSDGCVPAPGAPEFLLGFMNLHSEVLAVIDLPRLFGASGHHSSGSSWVLVMGSERAEFGVAADAVRGVRALRLDEVHDPPGTIAGVGRDCLRGVTGDALIVLDGAALMRNDRLFIEQREEAGTGALAEDGGAAPGKQP